MGHNNCWTHVCVLSFHSATWSIFSVKLQIKWRVCRRCLTLKTTGLIFHLHILRTIRLSCEISRPCTQGTSEILLIAVSLTMF